MPDMLCQFRSLEKGCGGMVEDLLLVNTGLNTSDVGIERDSYIAPQLRIERPVKEWRRCAIESPAYQSSRTQVSSIR